ncbi:YveK family protein [Loigolactobacillus coryniformis]|uniref:Capsular polysaccharide biosynthesis protein CpsC n=1 Tax=Loigolactobacillus coryniformis subsp. torquens DSM 20004 = KCTC 3535 TaxID=1423822 RepID=A0A2D1KJV0_9LACO|nr:Wzz/FepE/Etk N-terminal domain-containing protein [Loigolactobacillus coryniformis]ATO42403.1 chain-length determining protein [Loigolactobacillus coryniformis subsp. torquens DSM 20004 = KCTC 3535]ATO44961.1 chain-length determining protein [Loigolactobacillus coryniformis subsp. torquens DSM 20004 = KCTC 3535]KRK83844.1 capsular polysaccharide biosynthesis protein [Loigolactobacillus coryniformis subsp. torquens DSM 20004 = KCTC 3535]
MNETSHSEATLSIEDILLTLRKHLKIIIGSTIIVTLLAFVVTFFVMTPKYQSTTQLLVNRKLDDNQQTAVLQQTQADVQMINTYKDIITSPTILKDVAKDVGNGQTVSKLTHEISISSEQNSQVFSVNVKTTDPQEAAKIANITARTFRDKIKSIMSVNNVSVVSKATVNESPVSPRLPLNIAIGFVLGLLAGIGLAFLNEALDKTVKDEAFLAEAGLTSLGIVSEIPAEDIKKRAFAGQQHGQHEHHTRVAETTDELPPRSAELRRRVN